MSIYRGAGGSGDATNDATVSQVQTYASQAATSATNAASSATAAAASASGASTSATLATAAKNDSQAIATTVAGYVAGALASETAADVSASEAAASAAAAAISEGGASGSASDALDSANTATTQATAAATSATNSANSAASALAIYGNTTAMNTAVTNAGNSATAAATSATNAATSASNASSSASAASSSASAASTSASAAATSAGNAATSASNASSSASAASSSASSASTSASTATTQASNASTSATNASNSASTATTQAGIATTGATTATTQAGIATTQAGIATTGATTATTQAGIATTQATNAATSATTAVNSATNIVANRDAAAASATAASNSASASATSATSSATSASAAATSAAAASAVALGNEPVRHSVRPSLLLDFANTKQLDPRITFTRASTATFYDGKTTAKAEENLFTYSQEFDNAAWAKTSATATANTIAAPDGTTTAETITATATTARGVAQTPSVSAAAYTISIFAKAGTVNFAYIREYITNNTEKVTYFDLSSGSVGTVAAGHTASITSLGSGWYRCVVVCIPDAARSQIIQFGGCDANGSLTVTVGSTVYLWGAQLEQRSSVTAYTPTTIAAITNYIPAIQTAASGVARFDHNPTTGESLGLFVEEQRTNLLTYSSDFANAVWTKSNSTITSNTVVAPDGTLTGDKLVEDTTNNYHNVYITNAVLNATTYTYSAYVKAAERTWFCIGIVGATGSGNCFYDLTNGVVGTAPTGTTISITPVGNGWYRCNATFLTNTTTATIYNNLALNGTTPSYLGNGFNGIYLWGAQVEAGAFPTSYIATVASQVTRSADTATISSVNQSWLNLHDGTFYIESAGMADTNARLLSYGTIGVPTLAVYRANATNYTTGITTVLDLISSAGYNPTTNKVAINFVGLAPTQLCVNAGTVGAYSGTVKQNPGSSPAFGIGLEVFDNTNQSNTTIRKVAYYPKRLTNAELQGLTTI